MRTSKLLLALAVMALGCSGYEQLPTEGTASDSVETATVGPEVLPLTGDIRVHDPGIIRDASGMYYVFSTGDPLIAGGTVQIRRSSDLRNWTYVGNVFDSIPAWVTAAVPGVTNIWAPEPYKKDNKYLLYYSASTFGSNRSVIGLATNTTLNPSDPRYEWVDLGLVFESQPVNDYNAIDPSIIEDEAGTPYMAFGSFWSGIRMVRLQWPDGKAVPGQTPLRLADRFVPPNAIEAPELMYRFGYYYLFVSFDFCCQGLNSTYKIAVGRSRTVTGPYFDRLGTPLQHGGGTVILSERGDMFGPGGQSVAGSYMAHHWYDRRADGDFRLGIRRMAWDYDGWPRIAP